MAILIKAKKQEVDNLLFSSRAEARRYCELKLLFEAGEIKDLETQPVFECVVNGIKVCKYTADFRYWEIATMTDVVEEVKGFLTGLNSLRYRVFAACYPDIDHRMLRC